jgi:RNA polymerase sigma-70 factor (ECF subfamily)
MTSRQRHLDPARAPRVVSTSGHPDLAAGADATDLSLVRRAQSGERGAFDLLMLRYRAKVVKLSMRYMRNTADAEDAAQETFIKAYRGLKQFRGECAFYTWLYRIAINSAKNALRVRDRDRVGSTLDLQDARWAAEHATRLQELETPEALTFADDICGIVNAALEALPEALRTAVMLREIDHLSYEEIAAAMATPVGTVRSRVFRARDVIHHQLRRVSDGGLGRDNRSITPRRV